MHIALLARTMKVLTLLVVLSSSLDRAAVAKLLNLSLHDDPAAPLIPPALIPASTLPITLLGTLVDRARFCSAALVIDGQRGRTVYLGDTISGATVVGIDRDRLVVERAGALEEIRTRSAAAPVTATAFGPHLSLAEVQKNLPQLMTQIRAVPTSNGFKVFAIAPDSLFDRIGLKNGDVIHAGLDLLQKLKPGSPVSIEIERDGRTFSLSGWLD
jgi:general secretion pathway protein C